MSRADRPKVVFDCMTYLQATASPDGPAAACLRLLDTDTISLYVSADTLREVGDVLTRPRVRQKNPRLTDEGRDALLRRLARQAVLLDPVPRRYEYARDPKDEPYLNLALSAGAKYLVTRDKDLLDLMNEERPEGKEFRQRFPDLRIVDPVAFLRELNPSQGENPAPEEKS